MWEKLKNYSPLDHVTVHGAHMYSARCMDDQLTKQLGHMCSLVYVKLLSLKPVENGKFYHAVLYPLV